MKAFVEKQGIDYPVAIDVREQTVKTWHVDSFPDYYLIDRSGRLRVADLANADLDRAVKVLLAEPAPGGKTAVKEVRKDAAEVLLAALDRAKKENKRVLVHLGAPG